MPILEIGQSVLAGWKQVNAPRTSLHSAGCQTTRRRLPSCDYRAARPRHIKPFSAKNEDQLVRRVVKCAVGFKAAMMNLRMDISSKSVVVPCSQATCRISRILLRLNISMKVASTGTDIGVDSSSVHTRTTVKQQEGLRAGAKKQE